MTNPVAASIKVLAFDVFGTVVDWRSSVIAEGEQLGKTKKLQRGLGSLRRCVAGRLPAITGPCPERRTTVDKTRCPASDVAGRDPKEIQDRRSQRR